MPPKQRSLNAKNDAVEWAQKRQAQIEEARKRREEANDRITEEHTFQPRRVAKARSPAVRSSLTTLAAKKEEPQARAGVQQAPPDKSPGVASEPGPRVSFLTAAKVPTSAHAVVSPPLASSTSSQLAPPAGEVETAGDLSDHAASEPSDHSPSDHDDLESSWRDTVPVADHIADDSDSSDDEPQKAAVQDKLGLTNKMEKSLAGHSTMVSGSLEESLVGISELVSLTALDKSISASSKLLSVDASATWKGGLVKEPTCVLGLAATWQDSTMIVTCTSVAGMVLTALVVDEPHDRTVRCLRPKIAESLDVAPERLQFSIADGRRLTEREEDQPIALLFCEGDGHQSAAVDPREQAQQLAREWVHNTVPMQLAD
eukprot:TRINITY_DN103211_c0_g1_i1.p1 TRINITY_DN103211_c0_g1~~TRINITY_DN103211_c0_g1_i1.p1  ORF type:complete len:372 (+),score=44.33 TRINITY_DN103211_c0_g1_i1:43-1158(+)